MTTTTKIELLAIGMLLSIAELLLGGTPNGAGLRNAVSDLKNAIWEARDA